VPGHTGPLHLIAPNGTDERRIRPPDAYDEWPAWSPDGSRLAFLSLGTASSPSFRKTADPDLMSVRADGTDLRLLASGIHNDGLGYLGSANVEWAHDGTAIALNAWGPVSPFVGITYADGGSPVSVWTGPGYPSDFAWSPDGQRLVLDVNVNVAPDATPNRLTRLAVVTRAGARLNWASPEIPGLQAPSWSRDGTRIVVGDTHQFYVAHADGSGFVTLAGNPRWPRERPVWSPTASPGR